MTMHSCQDADGYFYSILICHQSVDIIDTQIYLEISNFIATLLTHVMVLLTYIQSITI